MNTPPFQRLLPLLSIALLAIVPGAFGALSPKAYDSGVPVAPEGERFLFVVETSSSMEDLQAAVEATVYEVIRKGADGYMRTGDTYALWTYNKELHAGEFSMRVWESKRALQQATIAAAFLNQKKYEKSANLKSVMENLVKVIRAVSNLTVFVVSEGSSTALGTPFDQAIQEDYRKLSRARRQAERPFITTLIVRDGWFVDAKVTVSGSALSMPERVEPSLAKTPPAPTNAPPPDAKRPASAVLAVRGVETTNTSLSTTSVLPAPATSVKANAPATARPKVMQIITKTNPPPEKTLATATATPAAEPATPATPIAEAAPRPPTNQPSPIVLAAPIAPDRANASVTTPPPPALASAIPPAATQVPATPAIVPQAASIHPAQVSGPSAPVSPQPQPQAPFAPPLPPPPAVAGSPLATGTKPAPPAPATPTAPATLLSSLLPSSAPLPVAARELNPIPTPAPPTAAAPKFPGIEAVVTQPSGHEFNWMLAYGTVLLVAAGALLLVVLRRTRSPHASIITQSMERR